MKLIELLLPLIVLAGCATRSYVDRQVHLAETRANNYALFTAAELASGPVADAAPASALPPRLPPCPAGRHLFHPFSYYCPACGHLALLPNPPQAPTRTNAHLSGAVSASAPSDCWQKDGDT